MKYLKIRENERFEDCITEIEVMKKSMLFDVCHRELDCNTVQAVCGYYKFNTERGICPLYLLIDEDGKCDPDPKGMNAFATFLYVGPEEMSQPKEIDYIAGPAILAKRVNDDIEPLNFTEREMIRDIYKRLTENGKV